MPGPFRGDTGAVVAHPQKDLGAGDGHVKKQHCTQPVVAQGVGEEVVQHPAELGAIQRAEDGFFRDGDLQGKPCQVDLIVFDRQILPEKFAQIRALGMENEFRMLHLAVFMEGIHQLR